MTTGINTVIRGVFQSTHPRGVRLIGDSGTGKSGQFQSTHPRGVRPPPATGRILAANFNPRTRVGCDTLALFICCAQNYFNPRTRVGCDFFGCGFSSSADDFNPRTRVGCDKGIRKLVY